MKIIVAGQDRTRELERELRREAEAMARLAPRRQPARVPAGIDALTLARTASESDYLATLIRLIRWREAVDTLDFDIPRKPGPSGRIMARLKALLWKLLRYQHDRIAFRQNLINSQLTGALAYEVAAREKEIAELKRRVAELEGGKADGALPANHPPSRKGSGFPEPRHVGNQVATCPEALARSGRRGTPNPEP